MADTLSMPDVSWLAPVRLHTAAVHACMVTTISQSRSLSLHMHDASCRFSPLQRNWSSNVGRFQHIIHGASRPCRLSTWGRTTSRKLPMRRGWRPAGAACQKRGRLTGAMEGRTAKAAGALGDLQLRMHAPDCMLHGLTRWLALISFPRPCPSTRPSFACMPSCTPPHT